MQNLIELLKINADRISEAFIKSALIEQDLFFSVENSALAARLEKNLN